MNQRTSIDRERRSTLWGDYRVAPAERTVVAPADVAPELHEGRDD